MNKDCINVTRGSWVRQGMHRGMTVAALLLVGLSACGVEPGASSVGNSAPSTGQKRPVPLLLSWPGPGEGQYIEDAPVSLVPGAIDTLLGTRKSDEAGLPVPYARADQVLLLILRGVPYQTWTDLYAMDRLSVVDVMAHDRSMHGIEQAWTEAFHAEQGEAFWFGLAEGRQARVIAEGTDQERLDQVAGVQEPLVIVLLTGGIARNFIDRESLERISYSISELLVGLRESGELAHTAVILSATHNLDGE